MEYQFEGDFTEEQKHGIRGSLNALGKAARSRGIESETGWRVERRSEREDIGEEELAFCAMHDETGVEFLGRTADDLARQINKAAEFLSKRR